jgi:hypothetical protein
MQHPANPTPSQERAGREEYGLRDSEFQRSMVMRSAARQATLLFTIFASRDAEYWIAGVALVRLQRT